MTSKVLHTLNSLQDTGEYWAEKSELLLKRYRSTIFNFLASAVKDTAQFKIFECEPDMRMIFLADLLKDRDLICSKYQDIKND